MSKKKKKVTTSTLNTEGILVGKRHVAYLNKQGYYELYATRYNRFKEKAGIDRIVTNCTDITRLHEWIPKTPKRIKELQTSGRIFD